MALVVEIINKKVTGIYPAVSKAVEQILLA